MSMNVKKIPQKCGEFSFIIDRNMDGILLHTQIIFIHRNSLIFGERRV